MNFYFDYLTCHEPMLLTRLPNGLCETKHSLKASPRTSIKLLTKAHSAASGKADEKRTTYPNCITISRCSAKVPSYYIEKMLLKPYINYLEYNFNTLNSCDSSSA